MIGVKAAADCLAVRDRRRRVSSGRPGFPGDQQPPAEIAGLGPFRLRSYVAGQLLVLERNPNYWRKDASGTSLPYLNELLFTVVANEDAQVIKFKSNETQILERVGADMRARYVGFKCIDKYYSSIDMASALHPQTILALDFEQQPLPAEFGFPARLRIPTKLGFKNPKHIAEIFVTNDYPGGYWEDQGYNWFSGS